MSSGCLKLLETQWEKLDMSTSQTLIDSFLILILLSRDIFQKSQGKMEHIFML